MIPAAGQPRRDGKEAQRDERGGQEDGRNPALGFGRSLGQIGALAGVRQLLGPLPVFAVPTTREELDLVGRQPDRPGVDQPLGLLQDGSLECEVVGAGARVVIVLGVAANPIHQAGRPTCLVEPIP